MHLLFVHQSSSASEHSNNCCRFLLWGVRSNGAGSAGRDGCCWVLLLPPKHLTGVVSPVRARLGHVEGAEGALQPLLSREPPQLRDPLRPVPLQPWLRKLGVQVSDMAGGIVHMTSLRLVPGVPRCGRRRLDWQCTPLLEESCCIFLMCLLSH